MEFRNPTSRGRSSALLMLKLLGMMGSVGSNMFNVGRVGGTAVPVPAHRRKKESAFSDKEYARRKKRQKMARESRRRNRKAS